MKEIKKILCIPGDGIGPEIMQASLPVLKKAIANTEITFEFDEAALGGEAVDLYQNPYPEETQAKARAADAILFAAIGGTKWDNLPRHLRPESGLLAIRDDLKLFANLRPAVMFQELVQASSLKPELVENLDILIVRELTGGIYFGHPRANTAKNEERYAFNTMEYTESEIRRLAKVAFDAAAKRGGRLCSVDKANVLEVSQLWRDVFEEESLKWPNVSLSHMYVDNAAMQLIKAPKQFDVIATSNLFGDILSDAAAMLTGSIGMLPSASLDIHNKGLYEPCHGSAPDIAGQDKANPLALMLSSAMMLRYTFNLEEPAANIESAVRKVLKAGYRTSDLVVGDDQSNRLEVVGTQAMGKIVLDQMSF